MKNFLIVLCFACAVFASIDKDKTQWIDFKSTYGKIYNSLQEEKFRFSIFQHNLRLIEEHNEKYKAGETTYTKKITTFADLTKEEFVSFLKLQHIARPGIESNSVYKKAIGDAPESIDWRTKGAVSEVRNQGVCGAPWAFSVAGTLEGFNYVKTNELVTLSAQQVIDCSTVGGCSGGGDRDSALDYVKEYGIETENSYPIGGDEVCKYNASAVFLKTEDFLRIENEEDLLSAVGLLGPVSVSLDATDLAWYHEGVFYSSDCTNSFNLAVLAVGYGNDESSGLDYWLVKNSWGTDWGEDGYFRIKRGDNECGIGSDGAYPVLQ